LYYNSTVREDYPRKRFLEAESLAKRESFPFSSRLVSWCELGDLKARQIGRQWFVDLDDWETKRANFIADFQTSVSPTARSPLLSLVLILLLIGIISWHPFADRFREGSRVLTAAVGATAQNISSTQTQVKMASVYDGLWIRLERLWSNLDQFVQTLGNNLTYFWNQAIEAWAGFVGSEKTGSEIANFVATTTAPAALTLDAVTLQNLKAQIKAELLRELEPGIQKIAVPSSPPDTAGLVVLPSSGDPARDEAIKLELKNSFSDQVEVKFDQSGQAGMITPIFRTGRGDNYLFILTPLKQNP